MTTPRRLVTASSVPVDSVVRSLHVLLRVAVVLTRVTVLIDRHFGIPRHSNECHIVAQHTVQILLFVKQLRVASSERLQFLLTFAREDLWICLQRFLSVEPTEHRLSDVGGIEMVHTEINRLGNVIKDGRDIFRPGQGSCGGRGKAKQRRTLTRKKRDVVLDCGGYKRLSFDCCR